MRIGDAELADLPPFDRLPAPVLEEVAAQLTPRCFPEGAGVIEQGAEPEGLMIIVSGVVHETDGRETISVYTAQDVFAGMAILQSGATHRFVAAEALTAVCLNRDRFRALCAEQPTFERFFFERISDRLGQLLERSQLEDLSSLMVARVRDAYIHPPLTVPAMATIREAVVAMESGHSSFILVADGARLGIATDVDIRRGVVLQGRSPESPIGAIANYQLLTTAPDELLLAAKLKMTKAGVKRLVVTDATSSDGPLGVLNQIDLFSYFSSHSGLITTQVERAASVAELAEASARMLDMIRILHARGVKVRYIAQLVSDLNRRIFERLYRFVVPDAEQPRACLLVMGSEGREEQILRTDQDNALILDDLAVDSAEQSVAFADAANAFTEALLRFGYPRCPGEIMVSNPAWRKSSSAYIEQVRRWVRSTDPERVMNLAIFVDARAVAGEPSLLSEAQQAVFDSLEDHQAFFLHFARPALNFPTPLGVFEKFVVDKSRGHALDLKRGGIFPIVHGIRSFALEQRIRATNTYERIERLTDAGALHERTAHDLCAAFDFLNALRLKAGLEAIEAGGVSDNRVQPSRLNKLERDLLKDSLQIVNAFKKTLTSHFRLNLPGA